MAMLLHTGNYFSHICTSAHLGLCAYYMYAPLTANLPTVARGLFLAKRGRPDILPTIAYLCTRVKDPTVEDWKKLMQLMKYLNGTKNEILTLSAENLRVIKWYVDASFAVHADFKSHTGASMKFRGGFWCPIIVSTK